MAFFINEKSLIGNLLTEEDETDEETSIFHQASSNRSTMITPEYFRDKQSLKLEAPEFVPPQTSILKQATDQQMSRALQEQCVSGSKEEKSKLFKEILNNSLVLMEDIFGNYVVQKAIENCPERMIESFLSRISGKVVRLSKNPYACRVIQKLLEFVQPSQISKITDELRPQVSACIEDSNANHVIQKCIIELPPASYKFVVKAIEKDPMHWVGHIYGCRVLQKLIEKCPRHTIKYLLLFIVEHSCVISMQEYGNYVVQQLLAKGTHCDREKIQAAIKGNLARLCRNKYASNVIEQCFKNGTREQVNNYAIEILACDNLVSLMTDRFANFVIQKLIEHSHGYVREILLSKIKAHEHVLKKSTLGKYVLKAVNKIQTP